MPRCSSEVRRPSQRHPPSGGRHRRSPSDHSAARPNPHPARAVCALRRSSQLRGANGGGWPPKASIGSHLPTLSQTSTPCGPRRHGTVTPYWARLSHTMSAAPRSLLTRTAARYVSAAAGRTARHVTQRGAIRRAPAAPGDAAIRTAPARQAPRSTAGSVTLHIAGSDPQGHAHARTPERRPAT
jgi:hypothetical protein